VWLRQLCNLYRCSRVPDTVEVSLRQKDDTKIIFLLNHQNRPSAIQFYKPMHDFLKWLDFGGQLRTCHRTGTLVLDERPPKKRNLRRDPHPSGLMPNRPTRDRGIEPDEPSSQTHSGARPRRPSKRASVHLPLRRGVDLARTERGSDPVRQTGGRRQERDQLGLDRAALKRRSFASEQPD